jgi:hypothetical protein
MRTITQPTTVELSDASATMIPADRVEIVEWRVAPEDEARWAVWEDCKLQWLRGLKQV